MDLIVKYIQILKVKLKLLVLSLYTFSPVSPEWQTTIYGFCIWYKNVLVFPYWTYLLPTAPLKWVVLQAAICCFTTRCHQSSTLDCNDHALSFCFIGFFWFFFSFLNRLSSIICYESILGWIRNLRCNIYYNMIISSSAAQRRISFLEIGYQ